MKRQKPTRLPLSALEESYSAQPDFAPLALNNPSVKSAALARESAGYDALSARRDFSPKIYGSAGATKSGDRVYPDENNYYIGFSASAPIFSGGETYYSM